MRTSPRWIVPIAVAGTIVGGMTISSAQADSTPSLPDRTPQQVLAAVAQSEVTAMSGTVVTRTDLGLPSVSLPGGGHGGASATDPQGLVTRFLTGKNTLRVWTDGATKQRVQLLDPFDELNVVRNGDQVWTYSARQNEVGKATLPARDAAGGTPSVVPSGAAELTPAQLADRAIAAAEPTTAVTLGTPEVVAGRSAYTLTLTPRTDATLVGRIVIAVDAEKGVPLQVEVYARGHAQPAIETGFTAVDFARPSAATFTFTPPKGATVTDLGDGPLGTKHTPGQATTPGRALPGQATPGSGSADGVGRPEVTGTGWASIVEFPAAAAPTGGQTPPGDPSGLLDQLTTEVDGGRAMSTRLLSVLLTDDGRILAGAVPVGALVAAARR